MAVSRQLSINGGQRVDVSLLRSLESAICNDFDVLAGRIIGGKAPLVVSGLRLISTGVTEASALLLEVADGLVIHFLASESGSIFSVPSDRAPELLNGTNPRVIGSFAAGATNYVGLDFTRVTDDSTADLQMFLDATLERETPKTVPLARVIDYRIVISTRDFSSTPGICPIAKVVTDGSGGVPAGSITDARNMLGRLGSGGATPDVQATYPWPSGRKESYLADPFSGGDKSISSLKSWMDATMTRIWEIGGGEQWYSAASSRNLRLVHTGDPFVSNGEFFEWDATHAHWQGLRVVFDNSTGWYNDIASQTTDLAGLTDLTEGECLYVDLDRTQNRSGDSALVAQKGLLATLGAGSPPGSRLVFAWLVDLDPEPSYLVTRDHVGGTFRAASPLASGLVKITANAEDPRVPLYDPIYGVALTGGVSRLTTSPGSMVGAGDIRIGLGSAFGDHDVRILTSGTEYHTIVTGGGAWTSDSCPALEVFNSTWTLDGRNRITTLKGYATDLSIEDARVVSFVETDGAQGMAPVTTHPSIPIPTTTDPTRVKAFTRPSRWWRADVRVRVTSIGITHTASGTGVGKTLTGSVNGALIVDGVTLVTNDRVLYTGSSATKNGGIYKLTQQGTAGLPFILTRAVDADSSIKLLSGMACKVTEGTLYNGSYWMLDVTRPVIIDVLVDGSPSVAPVFIPISGLQTTDQECRMWHDGSITVIAESPPYTGVVPAAPL